MPQYAIVITKPLPLDEAQQIAAATGGTLVEIKFHPSFSMPTALPYRVFDEDDSCNTHEVVPALVETNLNELAGQCHLIALEKGWYEPQAKSFGEVTALVTSELSEALEEHRDGRGMNEVYYRHDKKCTHFPNKAYEPNSEWLGCCTPKPEGIPIEWADAIIRMGDSAAYWGIDLDTAVAIKTQFNRGREYRHGGKKL